MPHSCKLHPQGDGDGKGCDSGAGACAKVRGGREGTGRRGRPGTLIQQPGWESLRASYPEGQPPGTGFREDRRAESTARPKRPKSGPRPETLVTGSTIRTVVSSPISTLRQQQHLKIESDRLTSQLGQPLLPRGAITAPRKKLQTREACHCVCRRPLIGSTQLSLTFPPGPARPGMKTRPDVLPDEQTGLSSLAGHPEASRRSRCAARSRCHPAGRPTGSSLPHRLHSPLGQPAAGLTPLHSAAGPASSRSASDRGPTPPGTSRLPRRSPRPLPPSFRSSTTLVWLAGSRP